MKPHLIRRFLLLPLVCGLLCCGAAGGGSAAQDRQPIGPGSFYPASTAMLKAAVQAMVADALPPRPDRPIAIVVPHAGYVFSGQIAADAWRQASAHRYDTIVIVGTNHTSATFRAVSTTKAGSLRLPR